MLDVYREIDFQLGRVLAALDLSETTFILFSMHGMKAGYAQDHFLPDVMGRVNQLYLKKLGHYAPPQSTGGFARRLRQTVPASMQLQIREMVGQNVQDWLVDREWRGGKDWRTTPAFPVPGGGDVGFIRLNVQGRERDGFLAAGDGVEKLPRLPLHAVEGAQGEANQRTSDRRDCLIVRCRFPAVTIICLPDIFLHLGIPKAPAKEISSSRPRNHPGNSLQNRAEGALTPGRASQSSPAPNR